MSSKSLYMVSIQFILGWPRFLSTCWFPGKDWYTVLFHRLMSNLWKRTVYQSFCLFFVYTLTTPNYVWYCSSLLNDLHFAILSTQLFYSLMCWSKDISMWNSIAAGLKVYCECLLIYRCLDPVHSYHVAKGVHCVVRVLDAGLRIWNSNGSNAMSCIWWWSSTKYPLNISASLRHNVMWTAIFQYIWHV